jgi:hypothetical protein
MPRARSNSRTNGHPVVHTTARRPPQPRDGLLGYAARHADDCEAEGQDVSAGVIRALLVRAEELQADRARLAAELKAKGKNITEDQR